MACRRPEGRPARRIEQERLRALRVAAREQDRQVATLHSPEESDLGRPNVVQNDAEVVHQDLQRGQSVRRHPVGQAGAPPVDRDHTGETSKPVHRGGVCRDLPLVLEVRHEAGDIREVDRALSENLIRDRDAIVLRVLDLRNPPHRGGLRFGSDGVIVPRRLTRRCLAAAAALAGCATTSPSVAPGSWIRCCPEPFRRAGDRRHAGGQADGRDHQPSARARCRPTFRGRR